MARAICKLKYLTDIVFFLIIISLFISYNVTLPKHLYDIISEAAKATNNLFHFKQGTIIISYNRLLLQDFCRVLYMHRRSRNNCDGLKANHSRQYSINLRAIWRVIYTSHNYKESFSEF